MEDDSPIFALALDNFLARMRFEIWEVGFGICAALVNNRIVNGKEVDTEDLRCSVLI